VIAYVAIPHAALLSGMLMRIESGKPSGTSMGFWWLH